MQGGFFNIPYLYSPVHAATDQSPAIGAEADAEDVTFVSFQDGQFLTSPCVPHLRCPFVASDPYCLRPIVGEPVTQHEWDRLIDMQKW
jgi:hypothetical protein